MNLNERTAILTGAASGIGRALAHKLAAAGCHLALVDRDAAGLAETLDELHRYGRRVSTHVLDLGDQAGIAALPALMADVHPAVHLLINNAGVALGGTFEQVSAEDFDWLMEINFGAVVRLTRAFLPVLRATGEEARIVNVSSVYGLISPPGQAAYSASKFAVRGFSNSLRHELEGSKVGVTVVHPGGVSTAISKSARAPKGADAVEVERARRQAARLLRMPPSRAAEIIIAGIERNKARVIVGSDALVAACFERLMPVRYFAVLRMLMRAAS